VAEPGPPACLNCGEKLLGSYCWRCGQSTVDLRRPLRELAGSFFEDVLSLDTRLLRSIGPLLRRPGFLTREYLAGRRARYAPPLRLFLIATLIFAGLHIVLPSRQGIRIVTGPEGPAPTATRREEGMTLWIPKKLTRFGDAALQDRLNKAAEKAKANPQEFMRGMAGNLPRAFFLLLPVFALLVKLFYWRQDRLYLDHLIFALHFHAFGFVILSLNAMAVRLREPLSTILLPLLGLWFLAYLAVSLRRVYGNSWPLTVAKLCGLMGLYGVAFLLAGVALIPITLYLL
jgi:hypothetical protein